ncbi:MAG: hypothetical protein CL912_09680 [Deltaproteobacteria bacterium]|nr:hypothetical protein [Deltaproteobacteria bacterium]
MLMTVCYVAFMREVKRVLEFVKSPVLKELMSRLELIIIFESGFQESFICLLVQDILVHEIQQSVPRALARPSLPDRTWRTWGKNGARRRWYAGHKNARMFRRCGESQ